MLGLWVGRHRVSFSSDMSSQMVYRSNPDPCLIRVVSATVYTRSTDYRGSFGYDMDLIVTIVSGKRPVVGLLFEPRMVVAPYPDVFRAEGVTQGDVGRKELHITAKFAPRYGEPLYTCYGFNMRRKP